MSLRSKHDHEPPRPDPLGDQIAHTLGAVEALNDTMVQLTTGMKTRDASRLLGADARVFTLAVSTQGNAGMISGAASGLLVGISVRETSNVNPVTVRVLDGVDASGALLWSTTLGAASERTVNFATGLSYTAGLFVQLLTVGAAPGTVEGALYISAGRGVR